MSTDKCKRRKGCNALSREHCVCVCGLCAQMRVCESVSVCVPVCVRRKHREGVYAKRHLGHNISHWGLVATFLWSEAF